MGTADKQGSGVGVQGCLVEALPVGHFDDLAEIHHRHPVRDVADHGEVVRHKEIGEAIALLQVSQQIDDLGLDGDIQGRDRLVAHHKRRLHGQGPGNANPLALPAGELVRVALRQRSEQPDFGEECCDALAPLLPIRAQGRAP